MSPPKQYAQLFEPSNAPKVDKLPFTLKDVKAAIPPEYYEASMVTSCYYLAKDFLQLALAYWVASWLLSLEALTLNGGGNVLIPLLRGLVWAAYWFAQGTTCFGIWVIAHECGHQAFFGRRPLLNDTVGYIIHTIMWAPYHSWRIAHATHHRYTNNIEKDTAFPPRRYPGIYWKILQWCPPLAWPHMLMYLVMGWPGHIAVGLEGNWFEGTLVASHFDPWSPLFTARDRLNIVLSDVGLVAVGATMYWLAQSTGWEPILYWYVGPLVMNYAWLVIVTFLQHTDKTIPHYLDAEWDFLKGALCTVDRDYGIFNQWMHHITNGHVMHHIVSTMPFYNAIKVTEMVKPILGKYYHTDDRPLWQQMWHSWFAHQASFLDNPLYLKAQKAAKNK